MNTSLASLSDRNRQGSSAKATKELRVREHGQTLLATLGTMVVLGTFGAAAMKMTSGSNLMAVRERNMAQVEAAADGATEVYYARWKQAVVDKNFGVLTAGDRAALPTPQASIHPAFATQAITLSQQSLELVDPWGYVINAQNPNGFTSENGVPAGGFFESNLKNFPGWVGFAYYYRATARAAKPSGPGIRGRNNEAAVTVNRYFQMTTVPLFQALIYFEEDLELHPGEEMTLSGKVHTNQDAWIMGYEKLQFLERVSYFGQYNEQVSPERKGMFAEDPSKLPYWKDNKQTPQSTSVADQLTQVERIEPFGTAPGELFKPESDPAKKNNNLNDESFHELIEPPVAGQSDPPAISRQRLFNKADIKIRINSSKPVGDPARVTITGTNLTPQQISNFQAAVGTTVSLYDRREQDSVPTTSVDVAKLNTAITSLPGNSNFNGVVYIDDTAAGKNAVRLQNGAELVRDLTIVSQDPVYIQGDFNTGGGVTDPSKNKVHDPNKVPSNSGGNTSGSDSTVATGYEKKSAAVIGDAVMILSNSWNDANASKAITSRVASHTTVNAALMAGYLPTDYKNNNKPGGGAHNLVRFLENWNGKDFSYNGSMVQVFVSEQYQGIWTTGQIYSPPTRRWSFDKDLLRRPPPGAINGVVFSRGRWERSSL